MSSVRGHASRQPRNRIVDPFFAIGHQRTSQAAGCRTGLHKPSSWLSPGMNCRGITFLRCDKDLALAAYPVRAFGGVWGFKLPSREGGKRLARPLQVPGGKGGMLRGTYLIHPSFPLVDPTSVSNLVWVLRDISKKPRAPHVKDKTTALRAGVHIAPRTVGGSYTRRAPAFGHPIASCGLTCEPTSRLDGISAEFQRQLARHQLRR
jgi:hypothetical protein